MICKALTLVVFTRGASLQQQWPTTLQVADSLADIPGYLINPPKSPINGGFSGKFSEGYEIAHTFASQLPRLETEDLSSQVPGERFEDSAIQCHLGV